MFIQEYIYLNDELYCFRYGRLDGIDGHSFEYNFCYTVMYSSRTNDAYEMLSGTLPPIAAAYRNGIIMRNGSHFRCFSVVGNRFLESKLMAFIAFEKIYYGNDIDVPFADIYIITDDGLVYQKLGNDELRLCSYAGQSDTVTVPDSVGGMTVTEIHPKAFSEHKMSEIVLPDGIKT